MKSTRRIQRTILSAVLSGVCAGLFIVPVYAAESAVREERSEIIRFGDIWEEETGKHVSIIVEKVVSGTGDIILRETVFQDGACVVNEKPFDIERPVPGDSG